MKGDIRIANYEKEVEQEAAYKATPSLYLLQDSEAMRNAIRSRYAFLLMPHCPATVVQRYRDGVAIICPDNTQPLVPLVISFAIPISPSFRIYTNFWLC